MFRNIEVVSDTQWLLIKRRGVQLRQFSLVRLKHVTYDIVKGTFTI